MTDLVQQLRDGMVTVQGPLGPVASPSKTVGLMREAAAEIERLSLQVDRLYGVGQHAMLPIFGEKKMWKLVGYDIERGGYQVRSRVDDDTGPRGGMSVAWFIQESDAVQYVALMNIINPNHHNMASGKEA